MRGAAGLGMMVIVIAFTECADADPEIVSTLVGGVETAIPKLRHVADGIHGPGHIVHDQHRHVETPEHAHDAERQPKCDRDHKMREHVDPRALEQAAIPNLSHIRRVTLGTLTEAIRFADQPHHVCVGEAVERAVNVFVGIRFQMMKAVIAHPRHGIAGQHHSRAIR